MKKVLSNPFMVALVPNFVMMLIDVATKKEWKKQVHQPN
jgi:hypothetical protein